MAYFRRMDTMNPERTGERVADLPRLTLADIRDLPTVHVWHATEPSLAALLRFSRSSAYDAVKRGEVPSLRIGGRVVVPVPALLRMLGDQPDAGPSGAGVTPVVTSEAGTPAVPA